MRAFFLHFILCVFSGSALSQNNAPAAKTTAKAFKNDRWDLEKYIWSYTHNKTGKNNKAIIDFNVVDNWQGLGDYLSISNNGKYFSYIIERGSRLPEEDRKLDSLIVRSTTDSWHRSFPEAKPVCFTEDNKQYILQNKDALYFLQLGSDRFNVINKVESYRIPEGRNEWIAYQLKNENTVVLQNLLTGRENKFTNVASYSFDNSKQWFLCQLNTSLKELLVYNLGSGKEQRFSAVKSYLFSQDGNTLLINSGYDLQYVDCTNQIINRIWSDYDTSKILSTYQFEESGKQVVFTVKDVSCATPLNSIWYYKNGMDKAVVKVNNETLGIPSDLKIQESASFTDNGNYIQLTLENKREALQVMNDGVQLDVWSYKDLNLQSTQAYLSKQPKMYKAIISVGKGQVITLESEEDKTLYLLQGDFAIVKKHSKETHGDRFWEKGYGYNEDSNWVVSLKDGSRRLLPTNGGNETLWFSPSGNYLVYFDASQGCHYFSYDLRTGKLKDISSNLPAGRLGFVEGYPFSLTDEKPIGPFCLAAWLQNDEGLLVYDNNDIWKLDLIGKKPALNITNDFGRSHSIIFSLFNSERVGFKTPILKENESLLLRAFDTKNKCNGFYRKIVDHDGDPELLSMGQYFMNIITWCQDPNLSKKGVRPVKVRDVDAWIVQRQSDTDAPNYYETIEFKSFRRLTNFQPQKEYNWLTEELHSFKHLDGTTGQGILYKPENFDSSIKYPVLIVFYGAYSNNLYQFPIPAYNDEVITPGESPNWLLNNGYLVFTPDIYVAPLRYGPEAFNIIEGAAKYLKGLPFVDTSRLGCCSHSWSAKLGSYVFTHSRSFAAIAISEGFLYANMINVALSTDDNGISELETVENGFQFGSLWKNKDLWIDQTTVLNVDKAKSPLLLFCNKESSQEYQNQTLQLFTALRRLEKKVWWLKYEKGGHRLTNLNEQKDFTIRYTQYFDHYLKEAPAPRWMTQGVPYVLRGIESRYELDPAGSCSKDCPICKRWNEKYKKDPKMFERPISEWSLDK